MESNKQKNLLRILFLVIAIVIVWFYLGNQPEQPQQIEKVNENNSKYKITQINEIHALNFLPADLPKEDGEVILQYYTAQIDARNFQTTKQYESRKTLSENMKIFEDYVVKKKWPIANTLDTPDIKSVSAKGLGGTVQFTTSKNSISSKTIVDITASIRVGLPGSTVKTSN